MDIQIDSAGLSAIYAANQSVTLARRVQGFVQTWGVAATQVAPTPTAVASTPPAVAWQVFQPVATNTVDWTDQYICFATTTPLDYGAVLTLNASSSAPMQVGLAEIFSNGQFTRRPQNGPAYVVANASQAGSYAFGLAQSATINGAAALCPVLAVPVRYNEAAWLTPTDIISIFLSSAATGATVIPTPPKAFSIVAPAGAAGPTVGFNDRTNMFFQIS